MTVNEVAPDTYRISSYVGDGGRALLDLSAAMREILGGRNGDAA